MQCLSPVESEVLNVVLAAEIVPDRMDDTQLLQALESLFGGGGSGGGSLPVATILPFAGSVAPEGFMICDGAELLAADYADLFTAIGTIYGVGQAAGSFKLPDLCGRAPIGAGQGDGLTDRVIGAVDGEEAHQLTIDEMPSHNHNNALVGATQQLFGMVNDPKYHNSGPFGQLESDGGDQPHNNMQPFLVVNYIIKV
ncbi:MAG: tail fiber protein [Thalassospira sp.]|uniref:phage tail protein n=1 Tax=Thalassospira sp. TaxID=1912094 RepID=UPI001B06E583|nr:tail fiber protein [Thalassospira sp.]MBO6581147.1 tail fiber protein [Thalassospira sp.]MBO6819745.1 tail fiber protein [Thalassospira sp.]MBO6886559.1 tail fiber protein [Thalassospira sp.]